MANTLAVEGFVVGAVWLLCRRQLQYLYSSRKS